MRPRQRRRMVLWSMEDIEVIYPQICYKEETFVKGVVLGRRIGESNIAKACIISLFLGLASPVASVQIASVRPPSSTCNDFVAFFLLFLLLQSFDASRLALCIAHTLSRICFRMCYYVLDWCRHVGCLFRTLFHEGSSQVSTQYNSSI